MNWKQGLKHLYAYVHSSIIYRRLKVETTQVSISGRVDKQTVVCTYNGILFNPKKGDWYMLQHGRIMVTRSWEEEVIGVTVSWVRRFSLRWWKHSGDGWWCWPPNNVSVFNADELYTKKWLKWSILCHIYFTTVLNFFLRFYFFIRQR